MIKQTKDTYTKGYDTVRTAATYAPFVGGLIAKIGGSDIANPAMAVGGGIIAADCIDRKAEKMFSDSPKTQFAAKTGLYAFGANILNVILNKGHECFGKAYASTADTVTDSIRLLKGEEETVDYGERILDGLSDFAHGAVENATDLYHSMEGVFVETAENGLSAGLNVTEPKQAMGLIGLTMLGALVVPEFLKRTGRLAKPATSYRQRRAKK